MASTILAIELRQNLDFICHSVLEISIRVCAVVLKGDASTAIAVSSLHSLARRQSMTLQLPTLDAGRVRLRQLGEHDLADLHAIFSDTLAMRYWSHPAFIDHAQTRAYLEAIDRGRERGDLLQWGIEDIARERIIGTTTLFSINHEQNRAEIGYILASEHWRQGLAREALRRLLKYARDDMRLRRIEADIDPRNEASLGFLENLGFQREGFCVERWVVAGEVQDAILLGLLLRNFADG